MPMKEGLATVLTHGWAELRRIVHQRDGDTCIASDRGKVGGSVSDQPCANEYGSPLFRWEYDHVKEQPAAGMKAPDDEAHLVQICPWHHRVTVAGSTWATANREAERAYLSKKYPAIWNAR